jgi:sugar/nucleoside kinase (ribokinase family)
VTILVAGNAALYDLIVEAETIPRPPAIGTLTGGPGLSGEWSPGGSAPSIALAVARAGMPVALWHPLPTGGAGSLALSNLRAVGIDLSRCPRVELPPGRCIIVRTDTDALAWSSAPAEVAPPPAEVLDGVRHLVVAPVWGTWTDLLLAYARDRSIPCSIVGMVPPAGERTEWDVMVADHRQVEQAPKARARVLAATRGRWGSQVTAGGRTRRISAAAAPEEIDPTGAGESLAERS